jgi:hypothetical protein
LAEGKLANVKLTGYYEIDFLGAAPTANENQSNSFTPRTRQYWGQAAFHNGWTFTAGQTWSLWTSNKKGIETRQEWSPAGIEAQYVVGYDFARLFTVRVTKNINNKMWFAASLENPEMLNPSSLTTPAGIILGPANGATGAAGGTFAATNTLATDFMPDIVAKVAFEPGWGHYEIKGLMRVFRDKFYPGATGSTVLVGNAPSYSDKTIAGGVGVNAILPLVPKKADLILQGNFGEGIGRYSDSTNVDVTYAQDGALIPLKEAQVLAGLELHPTPKLDWYFYGGDEYVRRNWQVGTDGKQYGYGAPAADNSGCQFANAGSLSCKANFRNLQEGTTGFWYRFYKGPAGTVQWGLQYEWIHKDTWAGTNVGDPLATTTPKASENIVMTSFRYVLP